MAAIITPPRQRMKRRLMRLELAMLDAKEKLLGRLSETGEKRRREIRRQLAIKF